MPTLPVQLKRNGTPGASGPSSLLEGELAINYADGKIYWKNASNVITSFTFQSYALASHTHAASDITSGTLDAARLPLATTLAAGAVIVGTGLGVSSGTVSVTYGTSSGTACQGNDSRLSDARTPTSHSHGNITNAGAIGSTADQFVVTTTSGVLTAVSAATARTTLSVQPTASPTFTGSVGINVTPTQKLHVHEGSGADVYARITNTDSGSSTGLLLGLNGNEEGVIRVEVNKPLYIDTNNTTRLTISSTGTATFAGQVLVTAGSVSACSVAPSGDPNTGLVFPSADVLTAVTNGGERMRIAANGDTQIGGVNVVGLRYFDVRNTDSTLNSGSIIRLITRNAANTSDTSTDLLRYNHGSFAIVNNDNGPIALNTGGSERVRVKATGAVRFVPLSADPSTGNEAGDVYYNSSTNKLRVYNGTSWVDLH